MICEICGEPGAFIRRVDRTYGARPPSAARDANRPPRVEHIPIVYCPNCQQTYFTSDTLQDLLDQPEDD